VHNLLEQWEKRRQFSPARLSVEARSHSGLALDAYCQATSPIRRYVDMIAHYQIKAVLRGEKPPLARETISKHISDLEKAQSEISKFVSHSQRYWILRYLERWHKQDPAHLFLALVLAIHNSYTASKPTSPSSPNTTRKNNGNSNGTNNLTISNNNKIESSSKNSPLLPHHQSRPVSAQVMLLDLGYEIGITLPRVPKRGELIRLLLHQVNAFENQLTFSEFETYVDNLTDLAVTPPDTTPLSAESTIFT